MKADSSKAVKLRIIQRAKLRSSIRFGATARLRKKALYFRIFDYLMKLIPAFFPQAGRRLRIVLFVLAAGIAVSSFESCFIFHGKNNCGDCPNFKKNGKPKKMKRH
jgi:hypothetical protein